MNVCWSNFERQQEDWETYLKRWTGIYYYPAQMNTGGGIYLEHTDRYKFVQKENARVIRFTHPVLNIVHHTVDVNYKLLNLEGEKLVSEVDETHSMRFFFTQEIIFHLQSAWFEVLRLSPFKNLERDLNERDWNFSIIAKAV